MDKPALDERIMEYYDQHPARCLLIVIVCMFLMMGAGFLLVDGFEKQLKRWNGWLWAHQTELVPGIQFNSDNCIGSSTDKYANRFCEEPPDLYKKYWIWKMY
jgi:hypothetical protein